jgi:hypothetical protein
MLLATPLTASTAVLIQLAGFKLNPTGLPSPS